MTELSSSPRPAAIVACSSCWTTAVTGAGGVVLGKRGDDVAHVLREEMRLEAWLVGALQRTLAMDLEHAARRKSAEQRLAHFAASTPALRASASASATTTSVPPITIWLHSLHSWPAPDSPMRTTFFGIAHRIEERLHRVEGIADRRRP